MSGFVDPPVSQCLNRARRGLAAIKRIVCAPESARCECCAGVEQFSPYSERRGPFHLQCMVQARHEENRMDSQTRVAHHHDGGDSHVHIDDSAVDLEKSLTDPVCGMKVGADQAKKIVHAGHDYFFCSVGCMTKFRSSPQSYLNTTKASEQPAAQPGTIYTCPMHPEIRKTEPGSCPICGMALEPVMPSLDDEENPELVNFRHRFWWTLPLSIAVFVLAMFGHMLFPEGIPRQSIIELVLSSPVVLWAGWPFFVRCAQSVRNRSPNMWTLIGSGVAAAYGYSVVATFAPGLFPSTFAAHGGRVGVYYEAAAVIVSLTLLGQILELRARSQTSAAIKSLMGLAPKTARRINPDGTEQDVPISNEHVGDSLRILSLIHISEPTRRTPISYAVF